MTPGILANQLFWTAQLPESAFSVRAHGRTATLHLRAQPLVDTFQFGGPLAIAAQVNVELLWRATGEPVQRGEGTAVDATSPAAFIGNFAEASCIGHVGGFETGFAFESSALTADAFFAEMGQERNGVFLS